ncbi:MAG: VanZ family protein [Microgenomates group bacterium]
MKLSSYLKLLPSIIWMCFIFFLSSLSTSSIHGTFNQRFLILKSFHLIEYAVLAILIYLPIQKIPQSILISYLYAITDEIHQHFVTGRTSKFSDTLIDLIGITLGIIIIKKLFSLVKGVRSQKWE